MRSGIISASQIPTRENIIGSFQDDQDVIDSGQPIAFLPNDVEERDVGGFSTKTYHIYLSGITPTGAKTIVDISLRPTFLVRVPDQLLGLDTLGDSVPETAPADAQKFASALAAHINAITRSSQYPYTGVVEYRVIRGYHFDQFQRQKGFYVKLFFNSLFHRTSAIKIISYEYSHRNSSPIPKMPYNGIEYECHTADDDMSNYYRVVFRDYRINTCGWNLISDYQVGQHPKFRGKFFLQITPENMTVWTPRPSDSRIDLYRHDRSLLMCWDIEAFRGARDGEFPDGEVRGDIVFMIGITIGYYWSAEPAVRIALTLMPNESTADLVVRCRTQRDLLSAFKTLVNRVQPEFIAGFNDGGFDWPFIAEKAVQHNMLKEMYEDMSVIPPDNWRLNKVADDSDAINNVLLGTVHRELRKSRFGRSQNVQGSRGACLQYEKVKIDPTTDDHLCRFRCFGTIPIDVSCIFRIIEKNPESSSLNSFLKSCKLPQKEDMPTHEMNTLFAMFVDWPRSPGSEPEPPELIADYDRIKTYCIYDAEACHLLLRKRNVIMDRRGLSNMAYTTMYDSIFRADSMKVINYVISNAKLRGIYCSNIGSPVEDSEKYTGSLIIPPSKGIQTSKASIDERISAGKQGFVYPYHTPETSYGAWAHVTPETRDKMVQAVPELMQMVQVGQSESEVDESIANIGLSAEASRIYKNFLMEKTGRPVSGIDFSSLYPSLMMTYNLSREMMITMRNGESVDQFEARAQQLRDAGYTLFKIEFVYGVPVQCYSVRHTFDFGSTADPVECNFGILPSLLNFLFSERKKVKKLMEAAEHAIKKAEKSVEMQLIQLSKLPRDSPEAGRLQAEIDAVLDTPEMRDTQYQFSYYTAMQLAIKVFMNTFYGVTGTKHSAMYMLEIACGITTLGQINLNFVFDRIAETGGQVVYGDTDSAYVICPDSIYHKLDIEFYSGRIDKLTYWTRIVELTFPEIHRINEYVNQALALDNGTHFLRTAYEEALFPVVMLAKKKYYGLPHVDTPNFRPTKLFIRGLEVRKRGVPGILKAMCEDVMWKSMDFENSRSLIQLVIDSLENAYQRKWNVGDFTQVKTYKPTVTNVTINHFVERMRNERGIIIKPVEKFKVVTVKRKPFMFDITGKVIHLKAGDLMELDYVAEAEGMEIDIHHYIESVCTQFARMIAYHPMFKVPITGDYKADDAAMQELTLAFVMNIVSKYAPKYENDHLARKRAYKQAVAGAERTLMTVPGGALIPVFGSIESADSVNAEVARLKNDVAASVKDSGSGRKVFEALIRVMSGAKLRNYYCDRVDIRLSTLPVRTLGRGTKQIRYIDQQIGSIEYQLITVVSANLGVFKIRDKLIARLIENESASLPPEVEQVLQKINYLMQMLRMYYVARYQAADLIRTIEAEVNQNICSSGSYENPLQTATPFKYF